MNLEFREIQKFRKWWHFFIAGLPIGFVFILFLLVQWDVVQTTNQQKDPILFIIIILFLVGLFSWFFLLKLETTINNHVVSVNYYGIPFCKRKMPWSEIEMISLVDYDPLLDYGGWGVKYGMFGNGWCYNVSGNVGIKIKISNKKPFLIGTQKKDDVEKIIHFYFKEKAN
jgi:hypothetical protein